MIFLVKTIGILIVIFGAVIAVSPAVTLRIFRFFQQGKRIYLAGAIRLFSGTALLLAAPLSKLPAAASALGVMFLASGLVVFLTRREKLDAFMMSYSQLPRTALSLLGLIAACFGMVIASLF